MTTTNTTTQTGTVEHIDPKTVIIEANVRPSAPVDKEFVDSIRENGVLTPVLGRRDEQGNILVRAGQRRTLGAREAGVATMPVYVVDADEKTTERIVQQMIENEQREALTDADRTAAWQQLAFGMSVATIAKRTGAKSREVKSGLTVAGSTVAASAITEYQLTLDQAVAIAEFEDDEEARAELVTAATKQPAQFAHVLQRLRDARATAEIRAAKEAEYAAEGYTVLPSFPTEDDSYVGQWQLRNADGRRATDEDIAEAPGRAVVVTVYNSDYIDIRYFVKDPETAGLRSSKPEAPVPLTDDERAAKSQERKTLITNNKAWDSAETVRREWLTSFLTRKTLPKDAAQFIARGLTQHRSTVGTGLQQSNSLAHKLLGVEPASYHSPNALGAIIEKTPTKAMHVALAVVLGGIEESTSRWSWRTPSADTAAYLNQIEAWGYTLSDVERIAAGKKDTPTETK